MLEQTFFLHQTIINSVSEFSGSVQSSEFLTFMIVLQIYDCASNCYWAPNLWLCSACLSCLGVDVICQLISFVRSNTLTMDSFTALYFWRSNCCCCTFPILVNQKSLFCNAERRQAEAARIRDKYPDRIPVSNIAFLSLILYNLSFHSYMNLSCNCRWLLRRQKGATFQTLIRKSEFFKFFGALVSSIILLPVVTNNQSCDL